MRSVIKKAIFSVRKYNSVNKREDYNLLEKRGPERNLGCRLKAERYELS